MRGERKESEEWDIWRKAKGGRFWRGRSPLPTWSAQPGGLCLGDRGGAKRQSSEEGFSLLQTQSPGFRAEEASGGLEQPLMEKETPRLCPRDLELPVCFSEKVSCYSAIEGHVFSGQYRVLILCKIWNKLHVRVCNLKILICWSLTSKSVFFPGEMDIPNLFTYSLTNVVQGWHQSGEWVLFWNWINIKHNFDASSFSKFRGTTFSCFWWC